MNSNIQGKFDSAIYDKLNSLPMSAIERQAAINAMHDADVIVDAVLWIARKIEQLGAFLFLKPSLKH
jgi:hypothetical protein